MTIDELITVSNNYSQEKIEGGCDAGSGTGHTWKVRREPICRRTPLPYVSFREDGPELTSLRLRVAGDLASKLYLRPELVAGERRGRGRVVSDAHR